MDHRVIDRTNEFEDRQIARAIRRDPKVLKIARTDLRRWMKADGKRVRPVFREWHVILHRLTPREIAQFICSGTPMSRRLSQSSPLAGILTRTNRRRPVKRK